MYTPAHGMFPKINNVYYGSLIPVIPLLFWSSEFVCHRLIFGSVKSALINGLEKKEKHPCCPVRYWWLAAYISVISLSVPPSSESTGTQLQVMARQELRATAIRRTNACMLFSLAAYFHWRRSLPCYVYVRDLSFFCHSGVHLGRLRVTVSEFEASEGGAFPDGAPLQRIGPIDLSDLFTRAQNSFMIMFSFCCELQFYAEQSLCFAGPTGPGTVQPALFLFISLFLFPFYFPSQLHKKPATMQVGMKDW